MVSLSQLVPLPFSVIEVNTLAARRALELAVEVGIDRVILEGDSKVLIQILKTGTKTLAHRVYRSCGYRACSQADKDAVIATGESKEYTARKKEEAE
nr:hypothetical protein CFP56_34439 [Quercus suber]